MTAQGVGDAVAASSGARGSELAVLEAKLAPPRVRRGLVPRPRLHRRLDATEGVALTLVSAPTGYGKTTAVLAWCSSREAAPAWVTVDAGDNDPVRLWTYVATAVDRIRPGLGRRALQLLAVSQGDVRPALDQLAKAVASYSGRLTGSKAPPSTRPTSWSPTTPAKPSTSPPTALDAAHIYMKRPRHC